MSIYLIVNVLDVFYHTANAKTVKAHDDRTGDYTLQATGQEGKYEAKLADGVTTITVTVEQDGYVTTTQQLQLAPGSAPGAVPVIPPGLSYIGKQELWTRNVCGSSRGDTDFNVEIYFVLGQLTDARDEVQIISRQYAMVTGPMTARVMKFEPILLDSSGAAGWKRFKHVVETVTPTGTVLFARRLTDPQLIALFVPEGVVVQPTVDLNDATFKPLNFHLFYHPSPDGLKGNYPVDRAFIDLISRYVFEWPHRNKYLVNQQVESGANPILVFPVGNPSGWMRSFGGQQSILELLLELRYFILRMLNVPYPNQGVGTCAVSGFSRAAQYVNQALIRENDYFHANVLTEVYGWDLANFSAKTFADNLKGWRKWNSLFGKKVFRIYTSNKAWFDAINGIDPLASMTKGADGAIQMQSPVSSLVFLPFNNFWTTLNKETGYQNTSDDYQILANDDFQSMHQLFPALFVEHALSLSKFPTKLP